MSLMNLVFELIFQLLHDHCNCCTVPYVYAFNKDTANENLEIKKEYLFIVKTKTGQAERDREERQAESEGKHLLGGNVIQLL